jgi:chorismate-pyruvate lyase
MPGTPERTTTILSHAEADPLSPLYEFYLRSGLPEIGLVVPESIPEPQRSLLVHDRDMTPTLEKFHGSPIELRILKCWWTGDSLMREVVLVLKENGRPVEFGAIRIDISAISGEARKVILENRLPFGTILKEYVIDHMSRPSAFLRVLPDAVMRQALGLKDSEPLYGRCNSLLDLNGRLLAEVVEILPPFEKHEIGKAAQ